MWLKARLPENSRSVIMKHLALDPEQETTKHSIESKRLLDQAPLPRLGV